MSEKSILKQLSDHLILRRGTPQDADALYEFNALIHSDHGPDRPNVEVGIWTRDLLERPHPTFTPGDFTIVEDVKRGKVVSSLNLISQTWTYAGIPFPVGRPELVGTLPEYRNQGLIRAQFEVIHQWSAQRGEILQAITGIPYYYRLYGYEMALDLGGGRTGYLQHIPKLKEGEREPFIIRPAVAADLALIEAYYEAGCRRSLVSCTRDDQLWQYELMGKRDQNVNRTVLCMIETSQGEPVGFLGHPPNSWSEGAVMVVTLYELKQGVSYAMVTPSVIRYLQQIGQAYAAGQTNAFNSFSFWLGRQHPVYDVLHERLPRIREPYAWYLRLPDLPGFLRRITPALNQRLAASAYAGHTGQLLISFYRQGLKLTMENGSLVDVENWQPSPVGNSGDAAFPGLTFLQLLFGYRSYDELHHAFADCWIEHDDAYGLLNALFPKQASSVWPVA